MQESAEEFKIYSKAQQRRSIKDLLVTPLIFMLSFIVLQTVLLFSVSALIEPTVESFRIFYDIVAKSLLVYLFVLIALTQIADGQFFLLDGKRKRVIIAAGLALFLVLIALFNLVYGLFDIAYIKGIRSPLQQELTGQFVQCVGISLIAYLTMTLSKPFFNSAKLGYEIIDVSPRILAKANAAFFVLLSGILFFTGLKLFGYPVLNMNLALAPLIDHYYVNMKSYEPMLLLMGIILYWFTYKLVYRYFYIADDNRFSLRKIFTAYFVYLVYCFILLAILGFLFYILSYTGLAGCLVFSHNYNFGFLFIGTFTVIMNFSVNLIIIQQSARAAFDRAPEYYEVAN